MLQRPILSASPTANLALLIARFIAGHWVVIFGDFHGPSPPGGTWPIRHAFTESNEYKLADLSRGAAISAINRLRSQINAKRVVWENVTQLIKLHHVKLSNDEWLSKSQTQKQIPCGDGSAVYAACWSDSFISVRLDPPIRQQPATPAANK